MASFKHQSLKLSQALGWELRTIKGAGHMVHHISPDEVDAGLDDLLEISAKAVAA